MNNMVIAITLIVYLAIILSDVGFVTAIFCEGNNKITKTAKLCFAIVQILFLIGAITAIMIYI